MEAEKMEEKSKRRKREKITNMIKREKECAR